MDREKILKDNERLIWKIANYFYGIPKEDLFQAGVVGLYKAINNYVKDSTTKFSTYAHDYIYGEMYLLTLNKNIKVSKDILKLTKKIEETRYALAQKYNYIPSNKEISLFLEIPLEQIEYALTSAKEIISLDNDSEDARCAYECIGAKENDVDTKILIADSFNVLNSCEQDIIRYRYYEDLTQSEVARKLKMTQVMVSRYEKKSLDKMREYLTL